MGHADRHIHHAFFNAEAKGGLKPPSIFGAASKTFVIFFGHIADYFHDPRTILSGKPINDPTHPQLSRRTRPLTEKMLLDPTLLTGSNRKYAQK